MSALKIQKNKEKIVKLLTKMLIRRSDVAFATNGFGLGEEAET